MPQLYDTIGQGYASRRRPDPRIASAIHSALADAQRIVNVGAGTGSYEPPGRSVFAVEPSPTMIAQRVSKQRLIRACGTKLPFRDAEFDAALAVLTLHHWPNQERGLAELKRVGRRVVLLTWDPDCDSFWLTRDYFPEIVTVDRRIFPSIERLSALLGARVTVVPVPIPHDCRDGFLGAYWRRPEVYLDAEARQAISSFAKMSDATSALERLRDDLADGTWMRRHGQLMERESCDLGYRLVICEG